MAVKAFPTAEGYGANSVGGRGGIVYEVTNLNDAGAGSFRAGVLLSGARTIVFRVGGTIVLGNNIIATNPFLTIAGQTAPGDGIQFKNYDLIIETHNVIVRFIRSRVGVAAISPSVGNDTHALFAYTGPGSTFAHDVIFDHCSLGWATDQTCDTYGRTYNCTIQWCHLHEGLNVGHSITLDGGGNQTKGPSISHSTGTLIGAEPWSGTVIRTTIHHCLYAQCGSRLPLVNPFVDLALGILVVQLDMRNNVIYNWAGDGGASVFCVAVDSQSEFNSFLAGSGATPAGEINLVGNLWKKGPNVNSDNGVGWVSPFMKVYAADNIGPASASPVNGFGIPLHRADCPNASGAYAKWPGYNPTTPYNLVASVPFAFPAAVPVTTEGSATVLNSVLDNVGVHRVIRNGLTIPIRDAVDARVVAEVRAGTGQVGGSFTYAQWTGGGSLSYPTINGGTAPVDSDHDGIPDTWATAHGLNPTGNPGPLVSANGYTNLENYLNELAGDVVPDIIPPAVPTGVFVR